MDLFHQSLFGRGVSEGMGGHVKEDKVLLLCGKYPFLYQVLGNALTNTANLVAQVQWIPSLPCGAETDKLMYTHKHTTLLLLLLGMSTFLWMYRAVTICVRVRCVLRSP